MASSSSLVPHSPSTTSTRARPPLHGGRPTSADAGEASSSKRQTPGALDIKENKSQSQTNQRIGTELLESFEGIVSLHEGNVMYLQGKLAKLQDKLVKSLEHTMTCFDSFRWSLPCGWDFERLVTKFEFGITVPELVALYAAAPFDSTEGIQALREIASTKPSKARMTAIRPALATIDAQSGLPISDSALSLNEFLHADVLAHANAELSRTDVGVGRLLRQLKADGAKLDDALRDEDTVAAERYQKAMVESYVELLEIFNSRLSQLILSSTDTSSFRSQVNNALSDAERLAQQFESASNSWSERVAKDLEQSEKVRAEQQSAHEVALTAHEEYVRTTRKKLQANSDEQVGVMEEIIRLSQRLLALASEREEVAQDAFKQHSAEQNRIANYSEFRQVHQSHSEWLTTLRDLTDQRVKSATAFKDYVSQMTKALNEKDVESDLKQLTLDEAKAYLGHYRGFVFCNGDLITRKELRSESLHRQQRLAQLLVKGALDAFDPKVDAHHQALRDANVALDQCVADIKNHRTIESHCTHNFKPVERVLQEAGEPFEHPLIEYAEKAIEDRQRYVDRTLEYVENEGHQLEHTRERLRRLQHVASQQREVLEQKASVARQSRANNPQASPAPAPAPSQGDAKDEDVAVPPASGAAAPPTKDAQGNADDSKASQPPAEAALAANK